MLSKTPTHIICHYSEIGLKGKNRIFFEKKLKENIKNALNTYAPDLFVNIQRLRGRFLIDLTESGQKSTSQIGADFEFLRQYVDLTGDVFDKRAGELDGRIVSLYSTAILTPLIVGADQDVEELKRRNAEILKKLEDAQKQIDELKKNTGGS